MRRRDRKKLDHFKRDHCFVWRRPRLLRKVVLSDADIDILWAVRTHAIEMGRLRMVARGLTQYAKPELGETPKCKRCGHHGHYVRTRDFKDSRADVWECRNKECQSFNLIWHSDRITT